MNEAALEKYLSDVESEALSGDDEMAHLREDELRRDVLKEIAAGTLTDITPARAAELALRTQALKFSRWYA
jgi:hypothetical protein